MVKLFRATRSLQMALFAAFLLCAVALVITAPASAKTKFSISVEPVLEVSIPDPDVVIEALADDVTYTANLDINIVTNNQTGYTIGLFAKSMAMPNTINDSDQLNYASFYYYGVHNDGTTAEYRNLYNTMSWGVLPSDGSSRYNDNSGGWPTFYSAYKTTNAPTSGTTESIVFGARAGQYTVSGVYDSEVVVTVVPNYIPKTIYSIKYMQEVDRDVIDSMEPNKEYQIRDQRDNKYYWVAKMNDGHVWMTQNLDFEISENGTDLDPQTTDVKAAKTISNNQRGVLQIGESDFYYKNGAEKSPVTDFSASSADLHYNAGSQYSWVAATAGGALENVLGREATESICPTGWTLPLYSDNLWEHAYFVTEPRSILNLVEKYDDKSLTGAPFYGITNSEGDLWSLTVNMENYKQATYGISIRNTPNEKGRYFDEYSTLTPVNNRVRCVTKLPHVLKFGRVGANDTSVMPDDIILDDHSYVGYDNGIDLLERVPNPLTYREGDYLYTFEGWSTVHYYENGAPIGISSDAGIGTSQYCSDTNYDYLCKIYLTDNWDNDIDILVWPSYEMTYDPQ